MDRAQVN